MNDNKAVPAISLFDVIGPIMTGPSSSHTAGAVRIGIMGRQIFGSTPEKIELFFYGALSETYKGHFTDSGIVAGLLGLTVDDPAIKMSLKSAETMGISVSVHAEKKSAVNPNTISMLLSSGEKGKIRISGITVGGGEILIDGIDGIKTDFRGKEDVLLVMGAGNSVEDVLGKFPSAKILARYGTDDPDSKTIVSLEPVGDICEYIEKTGEAEDVEIRLIRSLYDYGLNDPEPLFVSIGDALKLCMSEKISMSGAALLYEERRSGLKREDIRKKFGRCWTVMEKSIERGLAGPNEMVGGIMEGQDSAKMLHAYESGILLSGDVLPLGIAGAIASMETNASMGRVVACPTAGACGVIPGVLSAVAKRRNMGEESIIDALLVAGLFGVLVSMRAPISGALGGCQSEIGVASAMAAAGLAQAGGADPVAVSEAFALAMKSILGLICDPVAGPVEVPCIKRNAIGVANALSACDMALSGIKSIIPPDEVIDALINTQQLLPPDLRGSTSGGLGCTETACRLKREWLDKCLSGRSE